VRIITATHQNLEALVAEGKFREDLFHRLNVIRIHLPSLSQRREDIIKLANHLLHRAADELDVETKVLSAEAEQFFLRLPWPGNVRQLENTCRWLTVMCAAREILVQDMPPELKTEQVDTHPRLASTAGDWQQLLSYCVVEQLESGHKEVLHDALPRFETVMIEAALSHTNGKKHEAAKLLGWGRNTLTRKLKELSL
jgi:two-component system nitrogen regulation response regulator GlnG